MYFLASPLYRTDLKESIEYKNVSFAYDREVVLKNINLKIHIKS